MGSVGWFVTLRGVQSRRGRHRVGPDSLDGRTVVVTAAFTRGIVLSTVLSGVSITL